MNNILHHEQYAWQRHRADSGSRQSVAEFGGFGVQPGLESPEPVLLQDERTRETRSLRFEVGSHVRMAKERAKVVAKNRNAAIHFIGDFSLS